MLCNPFVNPLNRRQPWVTLLPTPRIPRWINLCHRSYPLHETPFLLLILSKNRYPTGAVSCGSATNPWVGREREECVYVRVFPRDGGKRGEERKKETEREKNATPRRLSWMALRDIVSRSAEEGQRDSWEEGNRFEGGLEEEKEGRRGSGESSGHATNANPLCVGADRCHSPLTYPNLGSGTETDHSSPPPPPPRCTLALCPFILFFF